MASQITVPTRTTLQLLPDALAVYKALHSGQRPLGQDPFKVSACTSLALYRGPTAFSLRPASRVTQISVPHT